MRACLLLFAATLAAQTIVVSPAGPVKTLAEARDRGSSFAVVPKVSTEIPNPLFCTGTHGERWYRRYKIGDFLSERRAKLIAENRR